MSTGLYNRHYMKSMQDQIINYITNDRKSLKEITKNTSGEIFSRILISLNMELWARQELIIDSFYEELSISIIRI